jgi:hypothetical protein
MEQTSSNLIYNTKLNAYETSSNSIVPSPLSDGRGWIFFDDYEVNNKYVVDTTQEQSSKVVVTGASTYSVNYLNGRIFNANAVPTSVSYFWNYVAVVPYWPGTTPPSLPFVSMSIESNKKEGFQLGGGVKNVRRLYFDVYATTASERDDISDVIHTAIFNHTIAIKDFSYGSYLNYDGTFNSNLVYPLASQGNIRFYEVEHKNVHSIDDWTDIQKFRSVVSGVYESFVDPI